MGTVTMAPRIHITGPSGSGTTTLGAALAASLDVPHLDTDDFYWAPSDVPFTVKRTIPERIELMTRAKGAGGWVISGSCDGWGDGVLEGMDLVVLLSLETPRRLVRLKKRERARFGDRILAGGDMERAHREFLAWAASYDKPYFSGRSAVRHEHWLSGLSVPVLRLRGDLPTSKQLAACAEQLAPAIAEA